MAVFTDDFARANGSLGGNWVTLGGTPNITGQYAGGSSPVGAVDTTVSDATRVSVTVNYASSLDSNFAVFPLVKTTSGQQSGYECDIRFSNGTYTFRLGRFAYPNIAQLASTTWTGPYLTGFTLSIEWNNGALTATYNGAHTLTASDSTYSAQNYGGWWSQLTGNQLKSIRIVAGTEPSLDVSPTVVGNYGGCTDLTLSGTNTSWTAGTPGTPTFTVDHGSISAQEVFSATAAQITYCPGNYLGGVVITDPSTAQTATIVVTSDPNTVPPSGTVFSQTAVEYIERSAAEGDEPVIMNRTSEYTSAGVQIDFKTFLAELHVAAGGEHYTLSDESTSSAVAMVIWDILTHRQPAGLDVSFRDQLAQIATDTYDLLLRWQVGETIGRWKIDEVLDILGGITHKSHVDILDAIDGISIDPSAIIDEIHALRGAEGSTVEGAITLIQGLATIAGYDLSTVRDWIEAARGSGLPTIKNVMDKLLLIQPGNVPSLVDIDTHIVQQTTIQAIMDLAVGSLRGGNAGATITGVLDAIDDLSSNLPAAGGAPTLWPGVDNVDLGTEVAIVDGMTVDGPMHGLLMTVTAQPVRYQTYLFGEVNSWARVGAVIFGTDRDDYERSQTFGLDRQILVPQTMESADSAIIRINEGWEGTVRTWKRST